jgi:hypothetical protein
VAVQLRLPMDGMTLTPGSWTETSGYPRPVPGPAAEPPPDPAPLEDADTDTKKPSMAAFWKEGML